MWEVQCGFEYGIMNYYVEKEETTERCGTFDSAERAQEFADELNRRGEDGNGHEG